MSFDLIILKAKLLLTCSAVNSERLMNRRCAVLTRTDELILTILKNCCIEYDMNLQSV